MGKKKLISKKKYNKNGLSLLIVSLVMVVFTALAMASANALTDTTRPTIISISVVNNEEDASRNEQITVLFSEDMDSSTINVDTFTVMQRTTPEFGGYRSIVVDGIITYSGRTARFKPISLLSPNQRYGNVFTVMITTGAKDLAGNSISRDYVWSFTTGNDPFNTGATTSQLDQSAAPISGSSTSQLVSSAQPSIIAAPLPYASDIVTNTQAATASNFPWVWVIVGALLFLLIAIVIIINMKSTNDKSIQGTHSNPFGDIHPLIDIEGIGPEYNKCLLAMGIKNTKQLWEADAVKVARETGASLISVKSWQHMAELASVKGIGPQYAELLERSGIQNIDQLKRYDTDELLKLIRKKEDSLKVNIQGNFPGHATVEHWINEARDHKFSESEGQIA